MMTMRSAVLTVVTIASIVASTAAANAEARLKAAKCPFEADASFAIVGAKGEFDGVAIQYEWLATERPGWGRVDQSTLDADGRIYDLLTISNGSQQQTICFDITEFFGKGLGLE